MADKRYKRSVWSGGHVRRCSRRALRCKYDKHFSSLGRKRAPVELSEKREKERFRTPEVKSFEQRPMEFSRWSGQLAELQREARIRTDSEVQGQLARKQYQMLLQDTPQAYTDLAEELSMREINRFAFRRNRSQAEPGSVAARAGSGERAE